MQSTLWHNTLHWLADIRKDIEKKETLLYILVVAGLATAVFGLLLFVLDPNVHSLMDGVWSANELRSVEQESSRVVEEESRILQELARLHERLDRLESRLAADASQETPST